MADAESFLQLQVELQPFRKLMAQAAQVILDKDVSKYPIFVAHQQEMELGMPIYKREEHKNAKWSIHASTLEEFVSKQIIYESKVDEFRKNFKEVDTNVCVFCVSELGAQFLYLPLNDEQ